MARRAKSKAKKTGRRKAWVMTPARRYYYETRRKPKTEQDWKRRQDVVVQAAMGMMNRKRRKRIDLSKYPTAPWTQRQVRSMRRK